MWDSKGNSRINQQQLVQVDALAQHLSKHKPHVDSNAYPPNPPQVELSQSVDAPKTEQRMLNEEPKLMASSSISSDQPSYDGYNWRKYGQKQVKGSEYPRSYYKCTYPNCPVKKKVERSVDWKIAEIVYKGEHSHPKPEPPKCSSSGVQERGLAIGGTGHDGDSSDPKFCDNTCASIEGLDGRTENQNTAWFSNRSTPGKSSLLCHDPAEMGKHNARVGTLESSAGQLRGNNEEGNKRVGYHDDKPKSKRRKDGNQNNEAGTAGEGVLEPRISVQNDTEPEITGDGFHWRKYGQKVVKGNPYPRSYYRCTSVKCNVRKHVERALNDPRAFITKYEGRHNHEMPMKDANKPATPETDSQKPTAKRNSK